MTTYETRLRGARKRLAEARDLTGDAEVDAKLKAAGRDAP